MLLVSVWTNWSSLNKLGMNIISVEGIEARKFSFAAASNVMAYARTCEADTMLAPSIFES
jgi:hypothetical protein